MKSVWEATAEMPRFADAQCDMNTDILIIGGGMAGLLCAYTLDREGADYILVEAETLCSGITKNTTAKITAQHGLIYDKLVSMFGVEKARQYLIANMTALGAYRSICAGIDCDFEAKDSFVYSLSGADKFIKEKKALADIGYGADITGVPFLPFETDGAIRFKDQAQFNPLKFAAAIAPGLRIYEHTNVRELKGTVAYTDRAKIRAKRIIVATHFPFINKHGCYFLKMYQHRSYVTVLENAAFVDGMYVDEAENGMSFRNYKDLLFVGGGDHRTGKSGGAWDELEAYAEKYYPGASEKYRFATQDCMTLDGVPYIGRYSASTEGLYVATGFNKWGMSTSMAAARILASELAGRPEPYAGVFSPSRTMLRPQLAVNAFEATVSLLTPSKKRCPHLGCALKWNKHEHTWDCPCHGSRFTKDGKLIDNPATGNLK